MIRSGVIQPVVWSVYFIISAYAQEDKIVWHNIIKNNHFRAKFKMAKSVPILYHPTLNSNKLLLYDNVVIKNTTIDSSKIGICNWINNWWRLGTGMEDSQKVQNAELRSRPIRSGVPQGSVWAPFLYILYIRDLSRQDNVAVLREAA